MIKVQITSCENEENSFQVSGFMFIDNVKALKILWHVKSLINNPEDNTYVVRNNFLYFNNEDFNRLCSFLIDISSWRYYERVNLVVDRSIRNADRLMSIARTAYKF